MSTPVRLRPPSAQPSLTSSAVAAPLLTMQGEGTSPPYVFSRMQAFRDPYGLWFCCDHHFVKFPGRYLLLEASREARRS